MRHNCSLFAKGLCGAPRGRVTGRIRKQSCFALDSGFVAMLSSTDGIAFPENNMTALRGCQLPGRGGSN